MWQKYTFGCIFLYLMIGLHICIGFSLRTSLDQTTLNQSVSVNGVYSDQETSQVRYTPHCAYIKFSIHDRSNYAFTFMHVYIICQFSNSCQDTHHSPGLNCTVLLCVQCLFPCSSQLFMLILMFFCKLLSLFECGRMSQQK